MDQRFVYVFIHLFKTGGTTITGHLSLHMEMDKEVVLICNVAITKRGDRGEALAADWPDERRRAIRVITGHGTRLGSHKIAISREPRYFTIFRDPAPLMVSRYNFFVSRRKVDVGFWDWYPTRKPNESHRRMRRLLEASNFGEMQDALRRFWFVGVTEQLNDDLPHIFRELDVPDQWKNRRVAGGGRDIDDTRLPGDRFAVERRLVLNDEIRDRVHHDHAKDLNLYRFATKLREEMRERLGWM